MGCDKNELLGLFKKEQSSFNAAFVLGSHYSLDRKSPRISGQSISSACVCNSDMCNLGALPAQHFSHLNKPYIVKH